MKFLPGKLKNDLLINKHIHCNWKGNNIWIINFGIHKGKEKNIMKLNRKNYLMTNTWICLYIIYVVILDNIVETAVKIFSIVQGLV
jgi:hypothetical protein